MVILRLEPMKVSNKRDLLSSAINFLESYFNSSMMCFVNFSIFSCSALSFPKNNGKNPASSQMALATAISFSLIGSLSLGETNKGVLVTFNKSCVVLSNFTIFPSFLYPASLCRADS